MALGRWARSGTGNGGDAPNGVRAAAWHGVLSPRSLEVLCGVLRQSRGRWHAKGHGRVFILKVMQWPLRSVTMVERDHQRVYCSCLVLYTRSVVGSGKTNDDLPNATRGLPHDMNRLTYRAELTPIRSEADYDAALAEVARREGRDVDRGSAGMIVVGERLSRTPAPAINAPPCNIRALTVAPVVIPAKKREPGLGPRPRFREGRLFAGMTTG